jgi:hypothetical protein
MIETVTVMTDDIDGKTKANVTTHQFSIDGETYELEVGTVNLKKLQDIFAEYISHARRASASRHRRKTSAASANGHQRHPAVIVGASTAQIREWAESAGIIVKPRGRIAAEIVDRYHAAHP